MGIFGVNCVRAYILVAAQGEVLPGVGKSNIAERTTRTDEDLPLSTQDVQDVISKPFYYVVAFVCLIYFTAFTNS